MSQLSPSERRFDLAAWLESNVSIPYRSADEWLLDCPVCHKEAKLAVNVAKKAWQCFTCTFAGWRPSVLVRAYAGATQAEAMRIVETQACGAGNVVEPLTIVERRILHRPLPAAPIPPGTVWGLSETESGSRKVCGIRSYVRSRNILDDNSRLFLLSSISDTGSNRLLANRLLVPVWDLTGRMVYWVARATGPSNIKVLNLPAPDKHKSWGLDHVPDCATRNEVLVGIHLIRKGEPCFLVEGPLDAVVCGPGFVACMGSKLSIQQAYLLASAEPSDVTIMFDGDDAGRKGAEGARRLLSSFIPTKIAQCPEGTDPADLGRSRCLQLSSKSRLGWQVRPLVSKP